MPFNYSPFSPTEEEEKKGIIPNYMYGADVPSPADPDTPDIVVPPAKKPEKQGLLDSGWKSAMFGTHLTRSNFLATLAAMAEIPEYGVTSYYDWVRQNQELKQQKEIIDRKRQLQSVDDPFKRHPEVRATGLLTPPKLTMPGAYLTGESIDYSDLTQIQGNWISKRAIQEARDIRDYAVKQYPREFRTIKDVQDYSDFGRYIVEKTGEQAPQILASLFMAAVAPQSQVAKLFAYAAPSFAEGAGEPFLQMKDMEKAGTGRANMGAVMASGGLTAALEALPGTDLMKRAGIFKQFKKDVAKTLGQDGLLKSLFRASKKMMEGVAVQGALQGATEAPQELIQMTAVYTAEKNKDAYGDHFKNEIWPAMQEAGLAAALTGGLFGGSAAIVNPQTWTGTTYGPMEADIEDAVDMMVNKQPVAPEAVSEVSDDFIGPQQQSEEDVSFLTPEQKIAHNEAGRVSGMAGWAKAPQVLSKMSDEDIRELMTIDESAMAEAERRGLIQPTIPQPSIQPPTEINQNALQVSETAGVPAQPETPAGSQVGQEVRNEGPQQQEVLQKEVASSNPLAASVQRDYVKEVFGGADYVQNKDGSYTFTDPQGNPFDLPGQVVQNTVKEQFPEAYSENVQQQTLQEQEPVQSMEEQVGTQDWHNQSLANLLVSETAQETRSVWKKMVTETRKWIGQHLGYKQVADSIIQQFEQLGVGPGFQLTATDQIKGEIRDAEMQKYFTTKEAAHKKGVIPPPDWDSWLSNVQAQFPNLVSPNAKFDINTVLDLIKTANKLRKQRGKHGVVWTALEEMSNFDPILQLQKLKLQGLQEGRTAQEINQELVDTAAELGITIPGRPAQITTEQLQSMSVQELRAVKKALRDQSQRNWERIPKQQRQQHFVPTEHLKGERLQRYTEILAELTRRGQVPVQPIKGTRLSAKVLLQNLGLTDTSESIVKTAKDLLNYAMRHEAKGSMFGYRQGRLDVKANVQQAYDFVVNNLPMQERGKALRALRDANTPAKIRDFTAAVNKIQSNYSRRKAIGNLRRAIKNIDIKHLPSQIQDSINGWLSKFNLGSNTKKSIQALADMVLPRNFILADEIYQPLIDELKASIEKRDSGMPLREADPGIINLVTTAITHIARVGMQMNEVRMAGRVITQNQVNQEIVSLLEKHPDKQGDDMDWISNPASYYWNELSLDARNLLMRMDGTQNGPLRKIYYDDPMAGQSVYVGIVQEYEDNLAAVLKRYGLEFGTEEIVKYFSKPLPDKVRLGGKNYDMTCGDIIEMFLHFTDPDTIKEINWSGVKFENKRNLDPIKLNPQNMSSVVGQMDSQMKEIASAMRNNLSSLFDKVNIEFERLNGFPMQKKKNVWPRVRDMIESVKDKDAGATRYSRKLLESLGLWKGRTGSDTPVVIRNALDTYYNWIHWAGMYIGMVEPIRAMRQVMGQPDVVKSINKRFGKQRTKFLTDRISDIENLTDPAGGWMMDITKWITNRSAAVYLGSNPLGPNLKQISGLIAAAPYLQSSVFKTLPKAYAELDSLFKVIRTISPLLRQRYEMGGQHLLSPYFGEIEQIRKLGERTKAEMSMEGLQRADKTVIVSIWLAAIQDAKKANPGMDITEVIKLATKKTEEVVSETQNVTSIIDMSGMSLEAKNNSAVRLVVLFSSSANKMQNLARNSIWKYKTGQSSFRRMAFELWHNLLGVAIAEASANEVRRFVYRGYRPRNEEEEEKRKKSLGFVGDVLESMAGTFYGAPTIIRRLRSMLEGNSFWPTLNDSTGDSFVNQGIGMVEEFYNAFKDYMGEKPTAYWKTVYKDKAEENKAVEHVFKGLEKAILLACFGTGQPQAPYFYLKALKNEYDYYYGKPKETEGHWRTIYNDKEK